MPVPPAPAGTYRLRVAKWHKRTSEVGKPAVYTTYLMGDEVDLDEHDATRLLNAGAVVPVDDDEIEVPPTPQEAARAHRDKFMPTVKQDVRAGVVGVATVVAPAES